MVKQWGGREPCDGVWVHWVGWDDRSQEPQEQADSGGGGRGRLFADHEGGGDTSMADAVVVSALG